MKSLLLRSAALVAGVAALGLSACTTVGSSSGGNYNVVAYKPHNPDAVKVKVSLQNQAVYVMEGDRALMVAATNVGLPAKPTPRGSFRVTNKIAKKRSGSYGFWVNGNTIIPGTSGVSIFTSPCIANPAMVSTPRLTTFLDCSRFFSPSPNSARIWKWKPTPGR